MARSRSAVRCGLDPEHPVQPAERQDPAHGVARVLHDDDRRLPAVLELMRPDQRVDAGRVHEGDPGQIEDEGTAAVTEPCDALTQLVDGGEIYLSPHRDDRLPVDIDPTNVDLGRGVGLDHETIP